MIPLIKHAFEFNQQEIVENSFFNCHVKGLHSIMLSKSPGRTIRMYITDSKHELWKNAPDTFYNGDMTLGFHPHEYSLTLIGLMGTIGNWRVSINDCKHVLQAGQFRYKSKLRGDEPGFEYEKEVYLISEGIDILTPGKQTHMRPEVLHTVCVGKGETAAWMVMEHGIYKDYDSVLYSNRTNIEINKESMYAKVNHIQQIYNLFHESGFYQELL